MYNLRHSSGCPNNLNVPHSYRIFICTVDLYAVFVCLGFSLTRDLFIFRCIIIIIIIIIYVVRMGRFPSYQESLFIDAFEKLETPCGKDGFTHWRNFEKKKKLVFSQ